MSREGGLSSFHSTLSAQVDLSLATFIHSLDYPLSPSKTSFLRVYTFAWRIVCWGLLVAALLGHHAPPYLGDLYAFISLSLQSHRHLRISIIDSIVGEFATSRLTRSFVIRLSCISHIVHPHILRRHWWWRVSSVDLSTSFSAQLSQPQSTILTTVAW
jgi:hypothetical protein